MTLQERFDNKWTPEPFSGCWLWYGATYPYGYGCIRHQRKGLAAHRVSYEIHKGDIPNGMCVCHTCDTPACVNPNHLFLGSKLDNSQDCVRKGRYPNRSGEKNGRCRLSAGKVSEILGSSESLGSLARRFGVAKATIADIKKRRHWKHIQ